MYLPSVFYLQVFMTKYSSNQTDSFFSGDILMNFYFYECLGLCELSENAGQQQLGSYKHENVVELALNYMVGILILSF